MQKKFNKNVKKIKQNLQIRFTKILVLILKKKKKKKRWKLNTKNNFEQKTFKKNTINSSFTKKGQIRLQKANRLTSFQNNKKPNKKPSKCLPPIHPQKDHGQLKARIYKKATQYALLEWHNNNKVDSACKLLRIIWYWCRADLLK